MEILIYSILALLVIQFSFQAFRFSKFKKNPLNNPVRDKNSLKDIVNEVFYSSSNGNGSLNGNVYEEINHKEIPSTKNTSKLDFLKNFDSIAKLSILSESAWYGAESIHNLLSVDQNVYDALSQLAGHHLDSLSDLHSYLQNWDKDWLGNLTAINNLQGHVAEFAVADHLHSLGHTVTFPEASNYPGVDMWVDGYAFNVKDVVGMESIRQHFANYPDVGVISNYDIDGLHNSVLHIDPTHSVDQLFSLGDHSDHLHVIDNALNHDAILNHTDHAADALTGNIDIHFPIITFALSSYREAKILLKGHTTIMNSAKNIGFDVAGIGGGSFAGGKAGAAVGVFIGGPIGAAIGGVIGAIGGGIAGKFATNKIKTLPYENAKQSYISDISAFKNKLSEIENVTKMQLEETKKLEQNKLLQMAEESKGTIGRLREELSTKEEQIYILSDKKLHELFQINRQKLSDEISHIKEELIKYSFFKKYIWPSEEYFRSNILYKIIVNEINDLDTVSAKVFTSDITQKEKTTLSLEILSIFADSYEEIKNHLIKLKLQREENEKHFRDKVNEVQLAIANERIKSFKKIKNKIEELRERADKELKPLSKKLNNSKDSLVIELRKLGKDPGL